MATRHTDDNMKAYLECANRVLESCKQDNEQTTIIPELLFRKCAGILLLSGSEIGLGVSSQSGKGVAMAHNNSTNTKNDDGGHSWSAPIAVSMGQFGLGAVVGKAHKDVLILLNPLAMSRLLKGQGELKIGADLGFAVGKTGGGAGFDLIASDNAGLATSVVYTFSKGVLFSVKVEMGAIIAVDHINEEFYGKKSCSPVDIVNGNVEIPAGPTGRLVKELHEKIARHCGDDERDEEKNSKE